MANVKASVGANALIGHRVVVTRAAEQADDLLQRLAAAGAIPMALPTIAIAPPADPAPLAAARRHAGDYRGFIFTSANAAAAFLAPPAPARPAASWVCAVGPATAAALAGVPAWAPDLIPAASSSSAEGVLAALAHTPLAGQTVLFPRSAIGRDTIPTALAARGVHVTVVDAYQTLVAAASRQPARTLFPRTAGAPAGADTVVFTSGSTARNLATLLGPDYRERLHDVALAALGASTRAVLEELGLPCALQAPTPTAASLVAALAAYWHARTARS